MPEKPASRIVVHKIELPPPSPEELNQHPRANKAPIACQASLFYPGLSIKANQTAQRQFVIFAGPKEYRTLANIAATLNNNLDQVMGFGMFGFFAKVLLLSMNWLHSFLSLSYGWAIVTITVIIKAVFWPLTQASTRSMKRMQTLQPQLKAIQEEVQGRSGQTQPQGDGVLEGEQSQPDGRVLADVDSDAGIFWISGNDSRGD